MGYFIADTIRLIVEGEDQGLIPKPRDLATWVELVHQLLADPDVAIQRARFTIQDIQVGQTASGEILAKWRHGYDGLWVAEAVLVLRITGQHELHWDPPDEPHTASVKARNGVAWALVAVLLGR